MVFPVNKNEVVIMKGKKIVVVLGGKINQPDDRHAYTQQKNMEKIAIELAKLIKEGHQLVITYDNNPQLENLYPYRH
jgi:carbamate kinase